MSSRAIIPAASASFPLRPSSVTSRGIANCARRVLLYRSSRSQECLPSLLRDGGVVERATSYTSDRCPPRMSRTGGRHDNHKETAYLNVGSRFIASTTVFRSWRVASLPTSMTFSSSTLKLAPRRSLKPMRGELRELMF